MLDAKQIAQKIERILNSRQVSTRQFLADTGLAKNTISNMKGGSMPSADKLATIAVALHIPLADLMEIEDAPDKSARSVIVDMVNGLSDSQADRLLAYLEGMTGK